MLNALGDCKFMRLWSQNTTSPQQKRVRSTIFLGMNLFVQRVKIYNACLVLVFLFSHRYFNILNYNYIKRCVKFVKR